MLTAAFVVLSVCANAQFQSTRPARSSSSSRISKASVSSDTDNYYRVQLGYAIASPSGENDEELIFDLLDNGKFKGVTGGFLYGINLNRSMPLFLELGINFSYLKLKEDYTDSDFNIYDGDWYYEKGTGNWKVFNLSVPVNLSYKIALGDGFSIAPHAGIHIKANLKSVYEYNEEYSDDDGTDWDKGEWSYFDKDEMDDDYVWKRVQVGGQVGIGFNLKCIYVGYQYQFDFTNLCKEGGKLPTQSIVLGYTF
jgi:hypothetical protein